MTSKSLTTTRARATGRLVARRLPTHQPPTHPGEMLLEEFLKPLGITQSAFATRLGVSFPRLNEVITLDGVLRRILPCGWRRSPA